MARSLRLPGFVDAHSHTFQRALRARAADVAYETWLALMREEARHCDVDRVHGGYLAAYRELRAAGWTAVGEFNLLGVEQALAAAAAAREAGITFVCVHAAAAEGLTRPPHGTVSEYLGEIETLRAAGMRLGLSPLRATACPRSWLEAIGRYAHAEGLPLHVHAGERPGEADACLATHGCRPVELLARTGCLTERTTVVHAVHVDGSDLDLIASHGSLVCSCPTSDADLALGFLPATRIVHRAIPLCVGTGANVRVDPFEELRALEGIARRQRGERGLIRTDALLEIGQLGGALALGLEAWAPIEVDLEHPALAGIPVELVPAALVAGCGADVVL